jgi:anti-sigma regulatory factor (Ser/Thr protein kinase)
VGTAWANTVRPDQAAGRIVCTLPPDPDSPALARNLVGDACQAWHHTAVFYPARLVTSELVTNAVEHTGSTITVALSHRAGGLLIAVSDASRTLPHLRELRRPRRGECLDERGRGLRTVQATAVRWGALPTGAGKLVWALVRPGP